MTENSQHDPTTTDEKERYDAYCKYHDAAMDSITSSSDEFDKNLLTFSSGTLGLSLAFIKDIVKLESAVAISWLYWSWAFLVVCILVTILSYRFSIQAQKRRLEDAWKFYMENDKTALNRETIWSRMVAGCATIGALLFFAGILSTVMFVYLNVSEEHQMSNKKTTDGRAPIPIVPVERGVTSPSPQSTPAKTTPSTTPEKKD